MNPSQFAALRPVFLSWNLRNIPGPDEISGAPLLGPPLETTLAEYPIDAWRPLLIEVPRNGTKKEIIGRCNHVSGVTLANTPWDSRRVLTLLVYHVSHLRTLEQLQLLVKFWSELGIPEEIPCLAIAAKCMGSYCEDREAQCVTVMVLWNDSSARIISLDWTEGPLEDCITPEWFMESSPIMGLEVAIEAMRGQFQHITWCNRRYSIYALPSCVGSGLSGEVSDTSYPIWKREWAYADQESMAHDLDRLLVTIRHIYYDGEVSKV